MGAKTVPTLLEKYTEEMLGSDWIKAANWVAPDWFKTSMRLVPWTTLEDVTTEKMSTDGGHIVSLEKVSCEHE